MERVGIRTMFFVSLGVEMLFSEDMIRLERAYFHFPIRESVSGVSDANVGDRVSSFFFHVLNVVCILCVRLEDDGVEASITRETVGEEDERRFLLV